MKKFFTFLYLYFAFIIGSSQWKSSNIQNDRSSNSIEEEFYTLDILDLREKLSKAQEAGGYSKPVVITIPTLGGRLEKFNVYSAPVMVSELANKYQLGSFAGVGIDDPYKIIRFSVAPDDFQAMIMKAGQYEFIEPANSSKTLYRVYPRTQKSGNKSFVCSTQESPKVKKQIEQLYQKGKSFANNPADFTKSSDKKYRTLRLALSVTGEYTALFGGTVAGALTQMNATMTRVNGVFEKDFALRLIIQNFPNIIYTNPATDPYSPPSGMNNWNLELQQNLTAVVGNANYDIGHLFGHTGGGGNAGCIGCICVNPATANDTEKGSAYTSPGSGLPQGDTFDIDYVAHEMGHQLGATHTFSHQLEGAGSNMEPGSGSTIMGYAGITSQNVQNNSDAYFHAKSIDQIQNNLIAKTCDIETNITANNPPVISPLPSYTIPKSTAFVLTASATDPENDPLTYTWEQYNNASTVINATNLGNTTSGAAFRSLTPTTSPTRYFPRLSSVIAGVLNNSNNLWEALPTVARNMTFRVTVRDNHPIANRQQTQFADQFITVGDDGPFVVTSTQGYNNVSGPITWNVVNTNNAPYNVANVKLDYSTDNGATWVTLIASTPNDGSEDVTFTGVPTGNNVIVRVSAINNVFYALKSINIVAGTTCTGAPPTGITISNVTGNSALVSWTAIPAATYVLQYSVVGSGTWTTIPNINTTSQALTGLSAGTNYIIQLATVCSATQGAFSASVPFNTIGPSPLPYNQNFNNFNDFVFVGTQTNKWFYGSAAGNPANSIYISNDSGVTNAYTNNSSSVAHAYKDLIIPAGTTIADFSFDWKSFGNDTNFDYLRVWLVPETYTPVSGTQIPAGAGRIQIGGNFQNENTWQTYSNPVLNLSSFAGQTMRLVFSWRNDGSIGTNPPAAVDNVKLFIPTCLVPSNLNAVVAPPTATLSWTPPTPLPANGYEYFISTSSTPPTSTTAGTPTTSTSVSVPISAGNTYYWWVRAVCSSTDYSSWIAATPFTPGQIGTGTTTSGFLPVYSCFGYNYSQQIYTAAEVGNAVGSNNVIKKIRFYVSSTAANQSTYNNWKVYLANTTQNNFATTTSWVPINQFTEVFSGVIPNMTANSWVEIDFTTPFIWDGTSNIVVAVDENTDNYSCTAQWGSYTAGTNRGIIYYSDTVNPNPAIPPTATNRYSDIPRIQLVSEPMPPCSSAPPTYLSVSGLTTTSANLGWMPAMGATYLLQWRPVTTPASPWSAAIPLTTSFYVLTGLTEQTNYEVRVAYVCSGVPGNYTTPLPFTTPALPYCPNGPTSATANSFVSNVTVNSIGTPPMINTTSDGNQYVYYDFASNPTKLVKFVTGTSGNQISVTKSWLGSPTAAGVGVWIDWNRDGDFSDAGEQIFTSASNTTPTVTSPLFTVPNAPPAYIGQFKTRMRVIVRQAGVPLACTTFPTGEVEDYDVEIIQPVPCTSAAPTNLSASNLTSTLAGSSATLTWMPAVGAVYELEWRPITTPASAWTTITPAPTNSFHILTGLTEQSNYEFRVRYICSGVPGAWASLPFTTPPLQYCNGASTTVPINQHITNVTVTPSNLFFPNLPTMVNNSGPSNYTDYYLDTTKRIQLVKGSNGNQISIEKGWASGTPDNIAIGVWIDWNRDGDFTDSGEQILNSAGSTITPIVSNITVPMPALLYTGSFPTKMRVAARQASSPSPCGTYNLGEVEDYAIEFIDEIPCNNAAPVVTISNLTHNSVTLSWPADPGGAKYIVQYKPVSATSWTAQIPLPSLTSTYTINGLTPSTQYSIEVIATCDNVNGGTSSLIINTKCDPAPPTSLSVTQITSNTALVTWDPVPTAVYVLQYREVGASTWNTVNLSTTNYTLTLLSPYTVYEVRVASECSGAINPYTTPKVFTTMPICEMEPKGLAISNLTMNSVQVDWIAIPGATYVLRYREVGASAWTTINVPTNTYTITGLIEETMYELQVANVCNGTQQVFTSPYVFTTPGLFYCDMSSIDSSKEYISNVTMTHNGNEVFNINSGASNYSNNTPLPPKGPIVLNVGYTYELSVSKKWNGPKQNEAVAAFIDFNRDGKFTSNERIMNVPSNQNTPVSSTFTVPLEAYASTYPTKSVVLRVIMSRGGLPEMCSNFEFGEVEDYILYIARPLEVPLLDPRQIIIHPVPTKEVLNITNVEDGSKYFIYDSAGRLVQNGGIFGGKIDVSQLINGNYMIDIEPTKGPKVQRKMIKE